MVIVGVEFLCDLIFSPAVVLPSGVIEKLAESVVCVRVVGIERDGEVRFDANAGVVVRGYKLDSNGLSFTIKTPRPTNITTRELPPDRCL